MLLGPLTVVDSAGSAWLLNDYFVGTTEDGEVVVFQGLRGQVLGVPLHTTVEDSCPYASAQGEAAVRRSQSGSDTAQRISAREVACTPIFLDDPEESARGDVKLGVLSTAGLDGARAIIENLRTKHLLPPCPTNALYALPPKTSPPRPSETPLQPGVDCRTAR